MKKRVTTAYMFNVSTGLPALEVSRVLNPQPHESKTRYEILSTNGHTVRLSEEEGRMLLTALKEELEPHVGQPCCPEGAVGEKGAPGEATAPKDRRKGSRDRRSSDKPVYSNRRKSLVADRRKSVLVDRRWGLPDRRESILLDRRGAIAQGTPA